MNSENGVDIKAQKIDLVDIEMLTHYEKNMNKHTPEQIERLIELIKYQGFRDPLIVQKGTGIVVAGNGRLEAARKMGMKKVPVTYQEFENEAQLYAFVVSHNAINSSNWGGGLDFSLINTDITDLGPELDIDMLGIKDFTLEPMDDLDYSEKNKEIDTENFGNDLEHTCPRCGFEFNE